MQERLNTGDAPQVAILRDVQCHRTEHRARAGDRALYFLPSEDPEWHLLLVTDPDGECWLVKVHSTWFEAVPPPIHPIH